MSESVSSYPLQRYISHPDMALYVVFMHQTARVLHIHDCYELVVVQSGNGVLVCNGVRKRLSQGMIFLVVPGETHCYEECRNLYIANIMFLPKAMEFLKKEEPDLGFYASLLGTEGEKRKLYPVLTSSQLEEAGKFLERMQMEQIRRLPGHIASLRTVFQDLVIYLARSFNTRNSGSMENMSTLSKMMRFISLNFQKDLRRVSIFRSAGCSLRTGNRLFAEYLNSTPMRELQKTRVHHAETLLTGSPLSVSEIADQCGFRDSNYFSAVFHKVHGISPSEFRIRFKVPEKEKDR